MITKYSALGTLLTLLIAASCAKGTDGSDAVGSKGPGGTDGDASADAAPVCSSCDSDGDGVLDPNDQCPGTPPGSVVNKNGCADSQLTPKVEPKFPSYGLTWTPTGSLGRAGGLTWTYTGIQRGDLSHIYWVVCDDPAQPCGMS